MTGFLSTLAIIWRLAIPYFRSEDRVAGRILLAAVVAIELAIVGINVLINQWNARFYNALQERAWDAFVRELLFFCLLAGIFIVLAVYQLYLNQWLQIRWRRFLTTRYLGEWLDSSIHYRMQLGGDAADNPDQRIAEDIKQFIDGGSNGVGILPIGLGLLNSVVTLGSFVVILWGLSQAAPLTLAGWTIPGYLVWAALIYAIAGTLLTHLVGRPLTVLNFNQQRYEADFRFDLVRARENSEQIALLHGELAERGRLLDRFAALAENWIRIMKRTKQLTFLTASYSQISSVFPIVMVSPAYFSGAMQLGGLTQTASAFNSVQGALSFFINVYRQFAEWRAVIARLAGFEDAIRAARAIGVTSPAIKLAPTDNAQVRLDGLDSHAAGRQAAGRGRRHRVRAARPGAGDGSVGIRQVDAVPRDRRDLAVRQGHGLAAGERQGDDLAAAALSADRHARGRGQLSGGRRNVRRGAHPRTPCGGRAPGARRAHRRGGALEPDAVDRRAAAHRHRARDPARARLSPAR